MLIKLAMKIINSSASSHPLFLAYWLQQHFDYLCLNFTIKILLDFKLKSCNKIIRTMVFVTFDTIVSIFLHIL